MKLTWYGHSCFLIETLKGVKILTDPFNDSIGYTQYTDNADIITISHSHFDHSDLTCATEDTTVIDTLVDRSICQVKIKGIPSFHDVEKGLKRGPNNIYLIEVDGLTICHLGDLGHMLDSSYIDSLGNIDILLVPVGGNYTIDGTTAASICNLLSPKYVIPMHYKTPNLSFPLNGPEDFLVAMKKVEKISRNILTPNDFPKVNDDGSIVILLSPPKL